MSIQRWNYYGIRDDSGQIVTYDDHLDEMKRVKDVLRKLIQLEDNRNTEASFDVLGVAYYRPLVMDEARAILAEVG